LKENPFLDSYVIEFLDIFFNFKEADLRKGLIWNISQRWLSIWKRSIDRRKKKMEIQVLE